MRTPNRNAWISLIPFYGLTSYFYLGWKYGLMCFGLNMIISTMISLLPFTFYDLTSDDFILALSTVIFFLFLFPLQFVLIRHFTKKRNTVLTK